MWTLETRLIAFNGAVTVDVGGGSIQPLRGVRIDAYRFIIAADGAVVFEQINQAAARTSNTGDFSFSNLPVQVQTQMVVPSTPPYLPMEVVNPASLPNLAFRVSVEAEVLTGGASQGTQFVDVYDEREAILGSREVWMAAHPERMNAPLAGSPPFAILIPEDSNEEALLLTGTGAVAGPVPGKEAHFLRVGRVTRDEVGEFGPASAGRVGYMNSASPSFMPGVVDAPFGGKLHVGGHFGADFLTPPISENLYYTVSFSEYGGSHTSPFDHTSLVNTVQILDPLFNKKYILPTPALPNGAWHSLNLGPFEGSVTSVEAPHDPALIGSPVNVYKRPGLPDLMTEYWPFWDLLAIWNSKAAPDDLIILNIELYEKTGGTDSNPELKKLAMTDSVNDHLPLRLDNSPPIPRLLPYDASIPEIKFHTAFAQFIGAPELVGVSSPMGICNEMTVLPGDANGNESILSRYRIEDESGNPHKHVSEYRIYAEYTPKAVLNAPDSRGISLKPTFSGREPIGNAYSSASVSAPVWEVDNHSSVVVPAGVDGWPPEPCGDFPPGPGPCPPGYQCRQYALEVGLRCSVRTINGWSRLFDRRHISRHIIIKRT